MQVRGQLAPLPLLGERRLGGRGAERLLRVVQRGQVEDGGVEAPDRAVPLDVGGVSHAHVARAGGLVRNLAFEATGHAREGASMWGARTA